MFEWTGQIGPATIFSGLAFFTTAAGLTVAYFKGIGIREADHAYLNRRFDALETRVTAGEAKYMAGALIDKRFEDTDRATGAHAASLALLREQFSDARRYGAETFATKTEMAALEERTNKNADRIVDRLDQMNSRLEIIGDNVIKALAQGRLQ